MTRDGQPTPLSFAQQDVWLHARLAGDLPVGNQSITIRRRGPLNLAALEAALGDLVRRHETWRTTFQLDQGQPVQVVGAPPTITLPILDLGGTAHAKRRARALAAADAARPFDLGRGPLYRARLFRLGDGDHRLDMTVHRAIADRTSIHRLLLAELAALYTTRVAGGAEPPAPTVQYRDFAARQGAWAETPAAARQLADWRRRLAGPPPILELFADRARPPVRGFRGARHVLALDPRLTRALRAAARETGVSLEVVLLAAFIGLLHRHTGEDDVVVGTLATGRRSPDLQALLGCFENPLALRVDLGGDPSFRTLVDRVQAVVQAAATHADVPFAHVVNVVQPIRDRARAPLFSYAFTFEPLGLPPPSGWELSHLEIDPGTADLDLHLDLHEQADAIVGALTYRTDLFEAPTIARIAAQLRRLLEAAATGLDGAMSGLRLLDEREGRQVIVEWNRTARPYPAEATVHGLVERQAARAPDRIAIVAGDTSLTYGELDARAEGLAARLRANGVGPGLVVGVAMERSPEVIVGYLAVLKAGGAYLPLSINDPPERMAFMVSDTGAAAVLTRSGAPVPIEGLPVIEVGHERDAGGAGAGGGSVTPDDLIYVMYTSGSSGRPKGVAVPHRGIVRLLFAQDGYTRLGADEVILQSTALSFDVSAFEIWGALVHGARLVLYPSAIPTARELREVIRRHGVTTMWLTPSVFNMVVDEDPECLAPLRQLDLGGEALSVSHVARAARALPSTRLINGYGPTECSVAATGYVVPRPVDPAAASIPIGEPIGNTTAYVLDRHLRPVPIGVPGELCLGGPGLARGYVNRPEETAARFVAHPFDPTPGARIYRTGDLARWRPAGALEYLGRLDAQVKIRGLRIEPGEIETVLGRHPGVREAAVIARGEGHAKRLVAYVVARSGASARPEELREHVRRALPQYMVPASFVALDALPLTANGKLDRRALAATEEASAPPAPTSVAARPGSLEAQLIDLWQALLGVRRLGVEDDFFELGGDSLTAARMIQQVGDLTGCTLPLAALYDSPTVEQLAAVLRRGGAGTLDVTSPGLTLNRGGDRPPLILFHGILTGGAFYTLRLARRLGPRQPVHVVHPFTGITAPVPSTIEAMVDEHLRVVRELQPRGPYRLLGYCNGGLVAYEVARRLREAGDAVELLALIAAAPVTPLAGTGRWLRRLAGLAGLRPEPAAEPVARLRSFVEALTALPPRRRPAFVASKSLELARRAARRGAHPGTGSLALGVMDLYHRIVMRYFPQPYPGPVVLLWPELEPWGPAAAAAAAWRCLVPSVRVHVVPGDHLAVVHEHLDRLVAQLAPYLDDDAGVATAKRLGALAAPAIFLELLDVLERASELSTCLA